MRPIRWGLICAMLTLAMGVAAAQTPGPLIRDTFEDSDGGWTGFGATAKVSVTHDAARVKEGKGALQFDYGVNKGEINVLLLPVEPGTLVKAKAFRFWVKTDYATTFALALQEKDGGRYLAVFFAPGGRWQQVEVALSDFFLSEEKDDPKDPDNKLDMDQVEAVGIGDFGQFFAQIDNADLAKLFAVKTGAHTLYMHDFTVTEDVVPAAFSAVNADVRLDTFVHPQLSWVGIGDVKLSKAQGKPLDSPGLQADYRHAPGKLVGLAHGVPHSALAGTDRLTFRAASTKTATLIVQVEERDGGKYNTTLEVPAGSEPKEYTVNFADFKPADDSHDANNKLDMDQVKQVLILDATGLLGTADEDNKLWIGPLRASAAK